MCLNDKNYTKAQKLFEEKIDKRHIQREEVEMLLEKIKIGEAISLSAPEDIARLKHDLDMDKLVYSNDMVLDMVLDKVRKHTQDSDVRDFIDSVKIGNIQDFISGSAYQKCSDNSHYSELGLYFLQTIQYVSDIAASLFINEEIKINPLHSYALLKMNLALVEAIDNKEDVLYIPEYGYAQYWMKFVDDNFDKYFTDLLVYYGREIYEMAVAFILGHELGHHFLGHTETDNISNRDNSWDKEYEADQFGIKFALEYMRASIEEEDYVLPNKYKHIHKNVDYRVFGIVIAFVSSGLFDKRAIEESKLHPSLQSRAHRILEDIENCFDKRTVENIRKKEKDIDSLIANVRELNKCIDEMQETE